MPCSTKTREQFASQRPTRVLVGGILQYALHYRQLTLQKLLLLPCQYSDGGQLC